MKSSLSRVSRLAGSAACLALIIASVAPVEAQPTPSPALQPVGARVMRLANGVETQLLSETEEKAIAIKDARNVFRRATEATTLRTRTRSEFLKANPEGLDAAKLAKPLKLTATGFSWVDEGAVTSIKNQNPYGTCWAFSLAAALESSWYLRHRELIDLSEQDLINCNCRKCGASNSELQSLKIAAGIQLEADNPYKGDGAPKACKTSNCGPCQLNDKTPYRAEVLVPVDPDYTDDGPKKLDPVPVDKLKQALRDHGPLTVKMHIPDSPNKSAFFNVNSDAVFSETIPLVYDNPQTSQNERNNGAHIINIVGYDDVKQAWLIKNSWGTGWGKNGFGWVKWGSNKIGMAAAWIRADAPDYPFTAVWRKDGSDQLQAYGWDYDDYRKKYDAIWPQGYRLQTLNVRMVGNKPQYNAVWAKGAAPEIQVYGFSYADYRKKYDELWKDGWRLHILSNYVESGAVKYTAVWRKTAVPEIQVYGFSYADYRKKYDELWKDGWRLHILSNYVDGGAVKYTAAWHKDPAPEIQVYDHSYADYRKKYDELWKDGWRLQILSNYVVNGSVKYTAVWRKMSGGEFQVYGWDYDSFRARDAELRKDGWRLAIVNPI